MIDRKRREVAQSERLIAKIEAKESRKALLREEGAREYAEELREQAFQEASTLREVNKGLVKALEELYHEALWHAGGEIDLDGARAALKQAAKATQR